MTSETVSRTNAADQNAGTIVRYTFGERVNHWIGALSYTYLLMTGLAFWSPYLYWLAAVVGGGPAARFWHPWLGLIFAASLVWSLPSGTATCKLTPPIAPGRKRSRITSKTRTINFLRVGGSITARNFFSGEFSMA